MSYVPDVIAPHPLEFRAQELNRFEFLARRIACKGKIELVSEEREGWLDEGRRVGGIDGG
ncbi:hypothetical protein K443DRAFT_685645 [Laccaria amethystina LaAM-08-1]|uniref:Uncharacterized protein n=1 Tax=Laccaria amethystina LaAM-08-1 TaxID=1095629 RepID=A0A0C9WNG3_9AGAR|nr:hypothetical protein K443DRAFT_685645 [Laccaria amethystina LaAM-08-1]